jgi:hypothetical protein
MNVARSGDLTSTRVLLAKWRGVIAAEQKDPGVLTDEARRRD